MKLSITIRITKNQNFINCVVGFGTRKWCAHPTEKKLYFFDCKQYFDGRNKCEAKIKLSELTGNAISHLAQKHHIYETSCITIITLLDFNIFNILVSLKPTRL